MKILKDFSLKDYNSFNLDVKARFFVKINSEKDLPKLTESGHLNTGSFLIVGEGSNILFRDNFKGTVIHPDFKGIQLIKETDDLVFIKVGAGENWDNFVNRTVARGLHGIENLSLIPGAVGSVPVQNIGAYGVEVRNVIHKVKGFHIEKEDFSTLTAKDCEFGYRSSIFKKSLKGKFIVCSVIFKLKKHAKPDISYRGLREYFQHTEEATARKIRDKVIEIRQSKLPDPAILGNAGSFFKNPVVDQETANKLIHKFPEIPHFPDQDNQVKFSAAWLIEQCGWKGKRTGDAGVYSKHALILVNYGEASGRDIYDLSERIKDSVHKKFELLLDREVLVIG